MTNHAPERRKWSPTALVPVILSVLVMAGGWVYNYATNAALLTEHDRRITVLEASLVPKGVLDEKEKAMALMQAEQNLRLDRLEAKLDNLATATQVQDLRSQIMQVRVLLNERTQPSHEKK